MGEVVDISDEEQRKRRPPSDGRRAAAERALAEFAGARDGIVTTEQLRSFGVGEGGVAYRVRVGRLHRLHDGVYALGHASVTERGRWRAAVCACGPGALLSHASAAALWGLREDPRQHVDVTVAGGGRSRRGIAVHRSRALRERDRAERHGIPVTAIPRTLLDLAGILSAWRLERAVIEAERGRLLDVQDLLALCRSGHRGAGRLREIVCRELAPAVGAASELELRFLGLCRRFEIPAPQTNVYVEGLKVDAFWPAQRLVVELDGYEYHRTPGDMRRDAARDRTLTLAGHRILRFGWDDVTAQGPATARTVLNMLSGRGGRRFP